MKTTGSIALSLIICCANVSCNEKKGSTMHVAELETQMESTSFMKDSTEVKESIKQFYTDLVFGKREATRDYMKCFCTDAFIDKLADAYDYDGEGYALWLLRSGNQDGTESTSVVEGVSFGADSTVVVKYNDMGQRGQMTLKMAKDGDTWKIAGIGAPDGFDNF